MITLTAFRQVPDFAGRAAPPRDRADTRTVYAVAGRSGRPRST